MLVHELREIFVACAYHRFHAARGGVFGKRADDVVGLHAVDHHTGPAQRLGDFADVSDLVRKVFGHRGAIGFVLGIDVVAKGFASGVKHAGAIICRVINAQFIEHISHTEDRAGGLAGR